MYSFPGGTGITRLTVYDDASPDGLASGTPHVHTASTEAYVVVAGRGVVQTLDRSGFRETTMEAETVLWFTPGTIHRIVNGGGLRVLCVMQNSGLPEAGDAVMAFPDEILGDPERYRAAASLPPGTGDDTAASASARRDLGVRGFLELRAAAERSDCVPLERFYARAAQLVQPRVAAWRDTWEQGACAAALQTGSVLKSLVAGDGRSMYDAALFTAKPPAGPERFGMCGRLHTYDLAPTSVTAR
ncbi:cupin domain-containing protein [Cryobacterium sp. Y57]|uniref:cupin domain-containing protein n=1 Tax=Cryobacterium sp. Y57 TaxID=2048287 RepID=UPI001E3CFEB5|nr:cupin domain-containing protein [Cryobacterium sp. Y57]